MRFDEAAGQPILDGGSQSSGSLSDELAEQRRFFVRDLRWVTAAIVTIMDLREERRGADGTIGWSGCQREAFISSIVLIAAITGVCSLIVSTWIEKEGRRKVTKSLFQIQRWMLPNSGGFEGGRV